MPPAELAAVVRCIGGHRDDGAAPLAVALGGRVGMTAADRGGRHVAAYRDAGLTRRVEALGWWRCDPAGAMPRIRQGPPLLTSSHPPGCDGPRAQQIVL
jgi:hypothetical protein